MENLVHCPPRNFYSDILNLKEDFEWPIQAHVFLLEKIKRETIIFLRIIV